MPDPINYTNPLGGHEVLNDLLAQIKKRLSTDCNLRATDGYSGGYSGIVSVKLHLNAVKMTTVEMDIPITSLPNPAVESFPEGDVEPVEIDEDIYIPLEPNLAEVRKRTEENSNAREPEPVEADSEIVDRPKRKYTRRAMAGAISE